MVMLVFHQCHLVVLAYRDTERERIVARKILHAQVDRLVRFSCVYLDEEFPRIRIGGFFGIDSDAARGCEKVELPELPDLPDLPDADPRELPGLPELPELPDDEPDGGFEPP